jgi:cytochrome c-type biogenesis protein CcmF
LLAKIGDTVFLKNGYMVYMGLSKEVKDTKFTPTSDSDLAISAKLMVYDSITGPTKEINPVYILRNRQYVSNVEDTVSLLDLYVRLENIIVKSQDSVLIELKIRQTDPKDDFIVLKALVFPYINVLWLGVIVMVMGFFISMGNRLSRTGKAA